MNNTVYATIEATEIELLKIWRQLLNREVIDTTSNFFTLGCHSLLLVQAIEIIENKFNIRLSFETLLENLTIKDLVTVLHRESNGKVLIHETSNDNKKILNLLSDLDSLED
ncbi:acyl carrier protein [Fontibacillus solani]|uniref:Acyl carrier protein n=1 Tax=Fontibacillus solani TaxID=1572857 RepID=A0A7W3XQS2_9BACL|nr:phosphopantetheine-binding protein [Fontibacillus solani]MBA9084932.1 acyl carrier protein [Fontibacillus solani]